MFQKARVLRCTLILSVLLLCFGGLSQAQVTGTLTGTVSDSSGAVVPGAEVTMKNDLNGDIRRTVSNNDGFFAINAVQPGDYTVSIEAKGFEKFVQPAVHFDAGDKRFLSDIALKVGSSTETVTVVAAAESITTVDSGEKSSVIGEKQLQNVAVVGRNAAEFIKILPGFSYTGGQTNGASYNGEVQGVGNGPAGSFSANGSRSGAVDITSDGAHVIDPGCNCGQAVNTNGDMTAELKVLTSNFGADSQKGPIVISAIGKQGGNQFHGEAYIYARNAIMNANDAYNNQQGPNPSTGAPLAPRPDTYYYYPGGQLSGPVLIPGTNFNKNHDKLFFFVAYEYYKQQIDNGTYAATVPTANMRQGNFNGLNGPGSYFGSTAGAVNQVSNGLSGSFPNNTIPASAMNPVGVNMMNFYPMPNANPQLNGGNNFILNGTKPQNEYQFRPRVDYAISDRTKLFVQYNRERGNSEFTDTLWWRPTPTVPWPTDILAQTQSDSISTNLTHTFSPTLTNEFVFTYTFLNLPFKFADPSKVDPTKLNVSYQHIFNSVDTHEIPSITGWGGGVANLLQPSGFESGSLYARKWLPTFADNLSKVWGTHTMKFGFYSEITKNEQPSDSYVNGLFIVTSWGGNDSGNAYADLMRGNLSQYQENNFDPIQRLAYNSTDFYAQDSWKVSRRFTLDYGLRIQHLGPWQDQNNKGFAIFNPAAYNPTGTDPLSGFQWCSKTPGVPCSGSGSREFFYNPRFGIAWDIFGSGKTVIRGGLGIYHNHDEQNVQASAVTVSQGALGFTQTNNINISQVGTLNPGNIVPSVGGTVQKNDTQQPRTMSYSFTISQRTFMNSLFEVSYVGNQGRYLSNWNNNVDQQNTIPVGALFANNGAIFANGNTSPSSGQEASFRPYSAYGTFKQITHRMYSNYNALQAQWNKQAGKLNFMLNYTFSKNLGVLGENGGGNVGDYLNLRNDYGPVGNDRTHVFNAVYIVRLPDPIHSNRILKGAVNGWQLSGITQFQSGGPLQAIWSPNFGMNGNFIPGTALPGGNLAGDGTGPSGTVGLHGPTVGISNLLINGTDAVNAQPILTCDPRKGLAPKQFINGNCFAEPTPGHNGVFEMPYMKGPAFFNSDLSLFKSFNFTEKKSLQFRVEAFNFLNHPLTSFAPSDNNMTLSFKNSGQISNSLFGYATSFQGHRVMQLAVKFFF